MTETKSPADKGGFSVNEADFQKRLAHARVCQNWSILENVCECRDKRCWKKCCVPSFIEAIVDLFMAANIAASKTDDFLVKADEAHDALQNGEMYRFKN